MCARQGSGDVGKEPVWAGTWNSENRRVDGRWKSGCSACNSCWIARAATHRSSALGESSEQGVSQVASTQERVASTLSESASIR